MPRKWWILSAVACGTFMATLDSSIVNIALPSLSHSLSADLQRVKWVVVIYFLVITCFLLPFGRISDLVGRRTMITSGFLIFTLGSALCGIAGDLLFLVISRGIQAIGGAMLMANGPAIITAAFPAKERGKALGILAMVVSMGLISGPSAGGAMVAHLGWRSIFLINIPIGILGMLLIQMKVDPDRRPKVFPSFDWAGAILQSVVLVSLILLIDPPAISLHGAIPIPISRLILLVVFLVFTALFLKIETLSPSPVLDLKLLKNQTFWTATLAGFLMFIGYSGISVLIPFYLEGIIGLETHSAGYVMTAIPIAILFVAPLSGRFSDRVGSHGLSFAGATIMAFCLLWISGIFGDGFTSESSVYMISFILVCLGIALGLFQAPNNNAIMGSVPDAQLSTAAALMATTRNLGLVVGTGMGTAIFSWQHVETQNFVVSMRTTSLILGFICSFAMIASLGKPRGPHWK